MSLIFLSNEMKRGGTGKKDTLYMIWVKMLVRSNFSRITPYLMVALFHLQQMHIASTSHEVKQPSGIFEKIRVKKKLDC